MDPSNAIKTTCAYCGVGCGILATVKPDGKVEIAGDPAHPANHGRLCAKGAALGATLGVEGRLTAPQIAGHVVSWDRALGRVAAEFNAVIAEHGPEAVAFYVSGQLLTEDYYVANKLMKGFIGAANIDTNSRLCMASTVAAHQRAFGEDVVPGVYADLELADLVVLVGSNLAWCHPVLHQRLLAARAVRGTRIVVIDPRATATSEDADLHLPLRAGTDVALFNGLLRHLHETGACDRDYIARHTHGLELAGAAARDFDPATVCRITGLERAALMRFYTWFTQHARTVTAYSQGVNQSRAGTDKVNAIINCHLATARIGQAGAGPLSLTGQPNAMGGREVGGMANTLAAHLEFDQVHARERLQTFWRSPRMAPRAGLKAVAMFEAVASGRIKALWIMATNPVVSLPDASAVTAALERCPFVVVSDISSASVTARHAEVLLPAAGWGEKDGTMTNSERRISRQRALIAPPGEARPDWWMVCEVAKRMGHAAAFDYAGPDAILREYAALTAMANDGTRMLDLGRLATIDAAGYAELAPVQWPLTYTTGDPADRRLFGDGRYMTAGGRARFVATPYRAPHARPDAAHPYVLNTGRIRDQWHTMTRSGRAARLCSHLAEPYVEMHPHTAAAHGLAAAELAVVAHGEQSILARVWISERQAPYALFVPMHWSAAYASRATVNALVPAITDPLSGQPEFKAAVASLRRFDAAWYGFAVTTQRVDDCPSAYWARMRSERGWRLELADEHACDDFTPLFAHLCGGAPPADLAVYRDDARGDYRAVAFCDHQLQAALFIAREPVRVARAWLTQLLGTAVTPALRVALLAGTPGTAVADHGAMLCSCQQIGVRTIREAIIAGHASVAAVATATTAGNGCGGCRTDIQRLIDQTVLRAAG